MNFNSIEFIMFLPTVLFVFYTLPTKYRPLVLLFSSYIFYMSWKIEYILLILVSTLTDYVCGICIYKNKNIKIKKMFYLSISIFLNLGLLFLFKYYNFFIDNVNLLIKQDLLISNSFLLPVGISFYTFQTMGYSIDVYKGRIKPESSIVKFALYVSYFPQLVAGPIERASSLLPQFLKLNTNFKKVFPNSLRIIIWGLFKKLVVADNLGKCVDIVYSTQNASSVEYLIATYFFAFQIYLDFSGYTDIAIGVSRLFGIKLKRNFRTPYFSLGMKDFWSRWHISLSTWFRDYLYIPLGGNKAGKIKIHFNLVITFLVSGLWHGANWTFIIWGFYNGILLVLEKKFNLNFNFSRNKYILFVRYFIVFNIVCLGWIFFRSENVTFAVKLIKTLFETSYTILILSGNLTELFIGVVGIFIVIFIDYNFELEKWKLRRYFRINTFIRKQLLFTLILMILFFSAINSSEFIYFQF